DSQSDFLAAPSVKKITRTQATSFLFADRPAAFNYTVEEAAHHAQHADEESKSIQKALAKDHSVTAEEAKFLSVLAGPLTFLTSIFAITAAYLEVQNGWMLVQPLECWESCG
ncbi:unnamed protein product, partial [Effrenium voratum]